MEQTKKLARQIAETCNALRDDSNKEKIHVTFYKAVCIYLLGGFTGTAWETLFNFCRGRGFVYCNGSLFTPFNFVYGLGALIIVLSLKNQSKVWRVWLTGALGGGAVEYALNFLEEKLLGTRSWNYKGHFLNINGRTTLVYMAFWGVLCVIVVFFVYRPLDRWMERLPVKAMTVFATVAAVFCTLDLVATVSAIFRYVERSKGGEGLLWASQILDRFCNDDFMKVHFPHLRFR